MAAVSVEVFGKRHMVRVPPMQPLSAVVTAALKEAHLTADPAGCQLLLNSKPLDLSLPLRLANIPASAKLQLKTGQEPVLGLQSRFQPASSPSQPTSPPAATSPALPPAAQPVSISQPDPSPVQAVPEASPAVPPAAAAPSPPQQHRPAKSEHVDAHQMAPAVQSRAVTAPAQAHGVQAAATESPEVSKPIHDPLGVGREFHVFRHAAADLDVPSLSGRPGGGEELPDSFYDFTAEDYHRVAASIARQNAQQQAPVIKTGKLREEEERRRAAAYGRVPIRVHLPDGMMLQADFGALEPLSQLQELVRRCVPSSIARFYLYTAPPKQVIKDHKQTVYKAGLVPAAVVYLGVEGGAQPPFLRPEVLALQAQAPPVERATCEPQQKEDAEMPQAAQESAAAEGAGQAGGGERRSASGAKLLKWMKLSK